MRKRGPDAAELLEQLRNDGQDVRAMRFAVADRAGCGVEVERSAKRPACDASRSALPSDTLTVGGGDEDGNRRGNGHIGIHSVVVKRFLLVLMLLLYYAIGPCVGLATAWGETVGIVHAFRQHGTGDGFAALLLPPWAFWRGLEYFWHEPHEKEPSPEEEEARRRLSAMTAEWKPEYRKLLEKLDAQASGCLAWEYTSPAAIRVRLVLRRDRVAGVALTASGMNEGDVVFRDHDADGNPDDYALVKRGETLSEACSRQRFSHDFECTEDGYIKALPGALFDGVRNSWSMFMYGQVRHYLHGEG